MAVLASAPPSGQDYAALIRRKLLSTLLAVATFAVVWLVVSPASATGLLSAVGADPPKAGRTMAPVCDPRGAIGFAPPPQIQDAELSLDIPADCFDVNPLESKNYVPGHRGAPIDVSSMQEPVVEAAVPLPALMLSERLLVPACVEARPPPGFRVSLERPPRV
jgi:hypothetical protein